ncbi:MAG: hypothetical protein HYR49_10750 [Gammaproteobacteria bacterium]|nr:hypothetical protein [Gammaproteobacteria bacterium]
MMPALTRGQHGAICAGVTVVILALIHGVCVAPALALREHFGGRVEILEFQYGKMSHAGARVPELQAAIAALRGKPADNAAFLGGKSPALAAAELQRHLEGVIESHRGSLKTARVMAAKKGETLPPVSLQVQVSLDVEALRDILHAVESGRPLLLLDNVLVRAREGGGSRRAPATAGNLDLQFTATGFLGR